MIGSYRLFNRVVVLACAVAFVVCASGACLAVEPGSIYKNSFALLIGINEYPQLPKANWLSYSVNDVKAMQKLLVGSYGFPKENIKTLTDDKATKANIEAALSEFADSDRIVKEDRILIYFSGHGQTVKTAAGGEMGFLIPYDAKIKLSDIQNAGPFMSTCLPMSRVWEYLQPCPAKHVLILADVCYSGMLAQSRALEDVSEAAVEVLAKTPARQVITAGGKGQKSFENSQWGHGAFTYKLIEKLNARTAQPGKVFTAQELFAEVQKGVGNLTQGKQTPQLYNKETEGEFLFVPIGESGEDSGSGNLATTPARTEDTPGATPVEQISTTGKIKVTSKPAGATVYVDEDDGDVERQVTPCVVEVDMGASKSKKVEVGLSLKGYSDAVYQVTAQRGKQVTLEGKLVAKVVKPAVKPAKPPAKPVKPAAVKPSTPSKPVVWVTEDFEGLAFSRPKDWTYRKLGDASTPGAQFAIVGPSKDGFAPNINLVVEVVGNMSLADYVKLSEANAPHSISDFKVLSRSDLKFADLQAKSIVYTGSPNGSTALKFKCVMGVSDDTGITFTFTALPSQFDENVKIFDTFLKSIKTEKNLSESDTTYTTTTTMDSETTTTTATTIDPESAPNVTEVSPEPPPEKGKY